MSKTKRTEKKRAKKTYAYDPHLNPALVWAGKAEHTSFEKENPLLREAIEFYKALRLNNAEVYR